MHPAKLAARKRAEARKAAALAGQVAWSDYSDSLVGPLNLAIDRAFRRDLETQFNAAGGRAISGQYAYLLWYATKHRNRDLKRALRDVWPAAPTLVRQTIVETYIKKFIRLAPPKIPGRDTFATKRALIIQQDNRYDDDGQIVRPDDGWIWRATEYDHPADAEWVIWYEHILPRLPEIRRRLRDLTRLYVRRARPAGPWIAKQRLADQFYRAIATAPGQKDDFAPKPNEDRETYAKRVAGQREAGVRNWRVGKVRVGDRYWIPLYIREDSDD